MPDLGFMPQFVGPVLAGEKPFTLRREWKKHRTPDIGAKLNLIVGSRTPSRRTFASAVVGFRGRVRFSCDPLATVVSDWRYLPAFHVEAGKVGRAISPYTFGRDPEALAKLDGFPDWFGFWRFHDAHRAKGSPDVVERELIGLVAVTEAFANA